MALSVTGALAGDASGRRSCDVACADARARRRRVSALTSEGRKRRGLAAEPGEHRCRRDAASVAGAEVMSADGREWVRGLDAGGCLPVDRGVVRVAQWMWMLPRSLLSRVSCSAARPASSATRLGDRSLPLARASFGVGVSAVTTAAPPERRASSPGRGRVGRRTSDPVPARSSCALQVGARYPGWKVSPDARRAAIGATAQPVQRFQPFDGTLVGSSASGRAKAAFQAFRRAFARLQP